MRNRFFRTIWCGIGLSTLLSLVSFVFQLNTQHTPAESTKPERNLSVSLLGDFTTSVSDSFGGVNNIYFLMWPRFCFVQKHGKNTFLSWCVVLGTSKFIKIRDDLLPTEMNVTSTSISMYAQQHISRGHTKRTAHQDENVFFPFFCTLKKVKQYRYAREAQEGSRVGIAAGRVLLESLGVRGMRTLSQKKHYSVSHKSQAALKAAGPEVKGERRNVAARGTVSDLPVHDGLPGSLVSQLWYRRVNQVHRYGRAFGRHVLA